VLLCHALNYKAKEKLALRNPFNLSIRPAAFSASGRYSTPEGRNPRIEGASIMVNCDGKNYLPKTNSKELSSFFFLT